MRKKPTQETTTGRDPKQFLTALRHSHEHARGVYRLGGCYELFRLLRTVWPEARPWYTGGHVYTEIGDRLYDIDGVWEPGDQERRQLRPLFSEGREPWKWRDKAAEARRGFQTRQLGIAKLGWELKTRLWMSRTRIRLLQLILPARRRRQMFRAILLRAQSEAIRVYDSDDANALRKHVGPTRKVHRDRQRRRT